MLVQGFRMEGPVGIPYLRHESPAGPLHRYRFPLGLAFDVFYPFNRLKAIVVTGYVLICNFTVHQALNCYRNS